MGRPLGSKNKPKNNAVEEVVETKPTPNAPVVVQKKHKGRPQGSKNKPKVPTTAPESAVPPIIADVQKQKAENIDTEDDSNQEDIETSDDTEVIAVESKEKPIRTMAEYKARVASMTDEEKAVALPVKPNKKLTADERKEISELTEDSHAALHKIVHSPDMEKFAELIECCAENMSADKRMRLQNSTEFEKPKYKTIYHKTCSILAVYFSLDFESMRTWLNKRYKTDPATT